MSNITSVSYRLRQAIHHFHPGARQVAHIPDDALNRLSPDMLHQFRILAPMEQHHLVKVHNWLRDRNADEGTITAGLIHDVGKACRHCHINVLDRGLHVMLSHSVNGVYRRFAATDPDNLPTFLLGLHRLANHAERGASAALQAGYSERVAELIRYHESGGDSTDHQLQLLREADAHPECI